MRADKVLATSEAAAPVVATRPITPGGAACAIVPVAELLSSHRDQMFALLSRHYDQVSRRQFDRDLDEKEWAILAVERGEIAGFSTLMRLRTEAAGRRVAAFYSGDTIAERRLRGVSVAGGTAVFLRHLFAQAAALPGVPHYYLHVAGTHLGYLMMPSLFRVSRPRYDQPLTEEARALLAALTREKHLDYDPVRSIVRFERPSVLRAGAVPPGRRGAEENPHLRFYREQNPGWVRGDRLASLVELTLDNLTPAARHLIRGAAAGR